MNNAIKKQKPVEIKSKNSKIGEGFCFHGIEFTVKEMQEALDAYHLKKKTHSDWLYNDDIAIFVDANVLLNVYYAPVPLRDHLARFLKDNKERLYMVSQVETEFMRHRLEFIDKYKQKLTTAASSFRSSFKPFEIDLCNLFKDLKNASKKADFVDSLPQTDALINDAEQLADNRILLNEKYSIFKEKLKEIKEKFEEEYHQLYEKVNIEFRDPILTAISQINILPPLSQSEFDFTRLLYEKLLERYKKDSDSIADYLRFPGSGEDKDIEKKKEPWGDLVIYHQLLSFMAEHRKDAIFLTNDVSKLDWVKKNGEPYSYYIADAYKNTKQTLFIIPVDDFLPKDYKSVNDIRMDEDSIGDGSMRDAMSVSGNTLENEIKEVYKYKEITKQDFLTELEKYSLWSEKFGENYVSESYFIHVVLGQQGYRFSKSIEMLNSLVGTEVERYDKEKDDAVIPSIRLIQKEEEPIVGVDEQEVILPMVKPES